VVIDKHRQMSELQIALNQVDVAIAEHQSLVDGLFDDGHRRLWETASRKLQSLRTIRRELQSELAGSKG
tara:strand:+ start:3834 stop:4040 length:207 start_codon:yes stop_codon:yes gene_type:complete